MFCEIFLYGLGIPGELDVEKHLMKNIEWLKEVFPFVFFNETPTSKHAEHGIKSLKYGVAHKNKHTRGRWYAKGEAYKSIRHKIKGEFVEDEYPPEMIIMDDIADIEEHNNSLHPNQTKYKGMTRKEVFLKHANPNLVKYEKHLLFRYIANETHTTIRNNDIVLLNKGQYCLETYGMLDRLQPNNYKVTAYWLPDENGYVSEAFLYQDDMYIGRVFDKKTLAFNSCQVEQTEADRAKAKEQYKRNAQFFKKVKDIKTGIPKFSSMENNIVQVINEIAASDENYIIEEEKENDAPNLFETVEQDAQRARERALCV